MKKKTYISPKSLTVQIRLKSSVLVVVSQPSANIDKTDGGIDPESFGTKGVRDVNLWDEEW